MNCVTRRRRHTIDPSRSSYRMTPDKVDILELLAQYKYLRSHSIRALLPERSPRNLGNTLRIMFDHGLLTKPREQLRGYNNLYCPDIYMLTPKGEQVLIERGRSPLSITRLYRQATDGPIKNFSHAMMVCDTLSSIHAGTLHQPVEFISWTEIVARTDHENPMKLPCALRHNGEALDTYVVPDGLFGLRYPNGQVSFFALECEAQNPIEPKTLKRASFLKKLLAYRDIAKTGVYKAQLKIPNLRVCVVAPTPQRIGTMMALTERIARSSNLFLFHDIPVQEFLYKAPPPFPELLTEPWQRAGMDSIELYTQ